MSENKFYELMETRGLGFLPKMNMVVELYKEDGRLDKRGWIKGVNHSLNLKVKFMGEERERASCIRLGILFTEMRMKML